MQAPCLFSWKSILIAVSETTLFLLFVAKITPLFFFKGIHVLNPRDWGNPVSLGEMLAFSVSFITGPTSGQSKIKGSLLGCFWEWLFSLIKKDCNLRKALLFHSCPFLPAFGNVLWRYDARSQFKTLRALM